MSDRAADKTDETDYSQTLFLPQTEFPMRAGLPQKEPEILEYWREIDLYGTLRDISKGRKKFILHDGPPYANGNIHIGHALNKTLKDLVTRTHQMLGYDSNYVPGWDCHGLPIEWKIEEEYRAKGKAKPDLSSGAAINAFRAECRAYAERWLDIQREEFKRLGVVGDWARPYSTMAFAAEAQIAREIMKFKDNGLLYRGSKPVMWSVVEKTALAEAEIEYHDYQSDQVWVKFPVSTCLGPTSKDLDDLDSASVVIWTTTPWTLPGNRAISYSSKIQYALYRVTEAPANNWAKVGDRYVLAEKLAASVFNTAKVTGYEKVQSLDPIEIFPTDCTHPLAALGYTFNVPLLDGDHVTDDAGTGFVHTAPGHGRDDFEIWMASGRMLGEPRIDTRIPFTVDDDGFYTKEAPGFEGKRVLTDTGEKGDANDAVIKALIEANALVARGRLKHQYPHSWRSKKPIIFRNTPQWFIAMDTELGWGVRKTDMGNPMLVALKKLLEDECAAERGEPFEFYRKQQMSSGFSLRECAFAAISATRWVPDVGENRIRGMVENKPDWVMSRQRAWGVPITVFVHKDSGEMLRNTEVDRAVAAAFEAEGADAWFAEGARARFLTGHVPDPSAYEMVRDVLDVWFDSGSTHSYVLNRPDLFPTLDGIKRKVDGGEDTVMYLEGSDQHRGWFQSSLLESCGTRGRAPFDIVLTHGFTLDEQGRKMSKSLGNQTFPQDIIKQSGADILRLWVASVDFSDDQRIGPEILKSVSDVYRRLRNTLRWMLGTLAHFRAEDRVAAGDMPALERLMLHKLAELGPAVAEAYANFDYTRALHLMTGFCTSDLSAFYFDIRKDALYCDPASSLRRRAALTVVDALFDAVTKWLAPILVFTAEEAWMARHGRAGSVHVQLFPDIPATWRDAALAAEWEKLRAVRSVVTGALERERAAKRIGASLEAAPVVHIADAGLAALVRASDFADICITSAISITSEPAPADAFRLDGVADVAVVVKRAEGKKCARSWRIAADVGADPDFPDVTARDAAALREWQARSRA